MSFERAHNLRFHMLFSFRKILPTCTLQTFWALSLIFISVFGHAQEMQPPAPKPPSFQDDPGRKPHRHEKEQTPKIKREITQNEAVAFFAAIMDGIKKNYVKDVPYATLLHGALSGMISGLDPHSLYLDPETYAMMKTQTKGEFGGVGIEITIEDGVVHVIAPIDDTPAYKAGIQAGDHIIAIDDIPTFDMTPIEAMQAMRGAPKTKVKLTVRRGDVDMLEFHIERAIIKPHPVKYRIEDNIGYLRLLTFNEHSTTELQKAIQEIRKKLGPKLIGFVLDLRNNPGGLLEQAITVTNLFLEKGIIVSVRGRDKKLFSEFKASGPDQTKGLPLVVIINGGSASGSEIVAGALQDHRRAVIVGSQTFGKSSVQQITPVTDIGAIKFTIAFYYTPSGHLIQKEGIIPDIKVEQQLDMKTINSDKRLREALLQDALDPDSYRKHREEVRQEIQKVAQQKNFKDLPDYQLDQAFNILRTLNLQRRAKNGG